MTDEELLTKVKSTLGVTGTYQDTTLTIFIAEVKEYMLDAGVKQVVVDSSSSVGVISRGVSDLWNYGSGNATLSNYFMQRVVQLIFKEVHTNVI